MTRRYRGLRGAVATLHGKADAIALALASMGVVLEAVPIDTDALGTFVGDVERPGAARDVVVEKARRGMAAARLPLGIATEGSFGPDPLLGFLPLHVELLAFVDDVHDQVIVLEHAGHETNWRTKAVRPGEDLSSLLAEIGLPTHAALVKPNAWPAEPGTRQAGAREAGGLDPALLPRHRGCRSPKASVTSATWRQRSSASRPLRRMGWPASKPTCART